MGIKGLLPIFKNITEDNVHISQFAGKRAAVDGFVWLHRYAVACAEDLCTGFPTNKFISGFLGRVRMLQDARITPVIVFDGGPLPSKAGEEEHRAQRRKEALASAKRMDAADAYREYMRAVDINAEMATRIQRILVAMGIEVIIAPYEADPQLAFLYREGLVDLVITEDSDMIPFGVKHMLLKLQNDGTGAYLDLTKIEDTTALDFRNVNDDMILDACILSGCDYLPSIRKVGIKTAFKIVKETGSGERAILQLALSGKYQVPVDYSANYTKARLCFRHQRVFDPRTRTLVHLTPLTVAPADTAFLGPALDDAVARGVADGQLHPTTRLPFDTKNKQWVLHLSDKVRQEDEAEFINGESGRASATSFSAPASLASSLRNSTQPSQSTERKPLTTRILGRPVQLSSYSPPTVTRVHRRWNPSQSQSQSQGSTPTETNITSQFKDLLCASTTSSVFKPVRRKESVKRAGNGWVAPVFD
ncbi:Exonuclease 1 EXO1 [Carpediemonas membranifera]|uniref:Exonuclease 1 EXO1 n=1 Tax=Carpediemonas membranifera TaxID=201153 RepID=A0A8J6E309_9EUKA|nr:Exonuclease 1 EXO1 [Carpediemonas membranifera]|eukprot:KAG9392557.1 Exonuclease 1 EXO1 [Carpediemonas membranifera]